MGQASFSDIPGGVGLVTNYPPPKRSGEPTLELVPDGEPAPHGRMV